MSEVSKPSPPKSISKLKKEAWRWCSLYNRQKDANYRGYVACVTCGIVKHWKEGDAWHFLSGRGNSILFEDRGIHFQCKPCNGGFRNQKNSKEDVVENYQNYMLQRYGESVVKELERLKTKSRTFTEQELEGIIDTYKGRLEKLNNTNL